MNKKLGRPPLPEGAAKDIQIGVRLEPSLMQSVSSNIADSRTDETNAQWVREAAKLQIQNPPIWVDSTWKAKELEGQSIDFTLILPNRRMSGIGELRVRENRLGKIAVDIFVCGHNSPTQGIVTRIWLAQEAVNLIKLNDQNQDAKFYLMFDHSKIISE